MKENNVDIKPIPKFCSTLGVLPTSYLMTLSYGEQVTWLCNYINTTIIPILISNNEAISSIPIFEEKVTIQLEQFQEILNSYVSSLDDVKEDIERINNTLLEYNNLIRELNLKIETYRDELEEIINSNFNTLKLYVDAKDYELNQKIDNIQIGEIQVYDPTTGVLSPLQIVLNNLYGVSNKDGLTASEFDALDLTATAFDSYQITAYEFDSQGKVILV